MFKTLYVRIVVYYLAAVLLGVVTAWAASIFLFQDSTEGYTEQELALKGQQLIQLYSQTQPEDQRTFLESAAQLSSVKMKITAPNSQEIQFYNWAAADHFCDCDISVALPWPLDGGTYQMELAQAASSESSGFTEIGLILLIVLLVGGFIILFFARRLVTPIQTVTAAAKQLATGDFDVRLPANQRDEMGTLSQAINHMAAELGQLDRERQEFVANVSHEFQSPLTLMKGFSAMLLEGSLQDSERSRALQIIIQESERLSRLSDNLLRLAALDSERYAINPAYFDLAEQIRRTVLTFEPLWSDKQLEVEMIGARTMVYADEELLNQVWINLMSNAIKFAPAGGRIIIELLADKEQAEIRFYDNGPPVPPEDRERIFKRFFKADRARDRNIDGNGLGLSIVKKIVDFHEGIISIDSEYVSGKAFVVQIPVMPSYAA
ncbi:sensor histidine kinase [Paenibacillus woosongensis]|uniref:Heme sensor protein HssS n=1 Tax=Paenibacillus woosongensis TaxID=307580 RepID=A0A7X2YXL3_9BACL|nr:HAMP domain-containing sensor histidine kinase [Paenibacillus woosongensis]MUG43712.1 HAMP domain-containing protein [Paenibacillus woosongensis]